MTTATKLRLTVNGHEHWLEIQPDELLISVLRDRLQLTGTKEGCGIGVCGLCSVLVDGVLLSSCLMLAVLADGAAITTIEGIGGEEGELTPLQEAFIQHGGFQCGICTPGQIVSATALLMEIPRPSAEQVSEWMMGNLCRCTGYEGISKAILAASEADRG